MRTVGEILKAARGKVGLSFEEIEKATKIRTRYLEALEANDFAKIPGGAPIAKGFIKNYAEFLGLSSSGLLAVFRRDFLESKTGEIIPRGMVEPLGGRRFTWTPKMTILFGLVVLFFALGGYLFSQSSSSFFSPRLRLFSPQEAQIVKENFLEVSGQTDPDATLFLNQAMKTIAPDGSFREKISLSVGENEIVIEAVNRRGQKTKVTRKVKYEP